MYLVNSDQEKYGTVIKGLDSQKALKNNEFPKTMVEGNIMLITHIFDNSKYNNHKNNNVHKKEK